MPQKSQFTYARYNDLTPGHVGLASYHTCYIHNSIVYNLQTREIRTLQLKENLALKLKYNSSNILRYA